MAKYIVIDDPAGGKRRVRKVEERRPGQGTDAAGLRKYTEEKRSWLASLYARLAGSRFESMDRADRLRVWGRILFFVSVLCVPLAALFAHMLTIQVPQEADRGVTAAFGDRKWIAQLCTPAAFWLAFAATALVAAIYMVSWARSRAKWR